MIGYLTTNHALIHAFAQPKPARRTRRETLAANRIFKLAPKLTDYVHEDEILAVKGTLERPISGLAIDSRRVAPGMVFFALPGRKTDGARFIDEAIMRGAVAIVAQHLPALPPARVTFIHVADARAALARVAQRFYRFPDRDLTVIGVTGTSGKTSVAHLLQHLLNGDQRVGLIGSINYDLGNRTVPSFRTTPEALDVYGMLAQMRDAGCRQAVVEVSSHGLDQQRVRGLQFAAAIFTNLTGAHLDYHGSQESSAAVKARLFTGENGAVPKVSAINLDDPCGRDLAARLAAEVTATKVVTYGEDAAALVRAENVRLHATHTSFRLVWPMGTMELESPLVGRANVSNLLAAVAAAWGLGRDPRVLLARLRAFAGVPGRMQRIDAGQSFNVLVDHAHTEAALRHGLRALRALTAGRVLVVFGCAGDRDRSCRAPMTAAVQEVADFAIATADNPRHEAIPRIFADMQGGVTAPGRITWIEDRRRAIGLALALAKPGDTVLIAGKGHESYQELSDTVIPFDDRQVSRELLARDGGRNG